jgi:hypothetical protein
MWSKDAEIGAKPVPSPRRKGYRGRSGVGTYVTLGKQGARGSLVAHISKSEDFNDAPSDMKKDERGRAEIYHSVIKLCETRVNTPDLLYCLFCLVVRQYNIGMAHRLGMSERAPRIVGGTTTLGLDCVAGQRHIYIS